jgi:hypothetical protein
MLVVAPRFDQFRGAGGGLFLLAYLLVLPPASTSSL